MFPQDTPYVIQKNLKNLKYGLEEYLKVPKIKFLITVLLNNKGGEHAR